MKIRSKSVSTDTLEPEEWFFVKVPEDEIVSCFYYEYARERDDIRELVCFWRRNLADLSKAYDAVHTHEKRMARERVTEKFWRELAQLTDSTCSQLLINLPEFPKTPWQKIRPFKRAKCKRLLTFTRDRYPDGILGGLWPETNQNALNAIRYDHMRTILGELVPFSIDWRGGVEKVISEFETWARKHYAELRTESKGSCKRRIYDQPATPLARLKACPQANPVQIARLEQLMAGLDPFGLKEKIEQKLRAILRQQVRPSLHQAA